jgi:SAM-dependent methyltransferase
MMHLTRYSMYQQIRASAPLPMRGRVLGISGIANFRSMMHPGASVVDTQFPDVDLQDLDYPDGEFDWVITDQVLEHLPNPQRAISESFRVLRLGGIAIHTTCFLNPVHRYPDDYWRFSCDGLAMLCRPYAEILHCSSWGNRYACALIALIDRARNIEIPDRAGVRHWLATHNEPDYPIHVWVVARRT